MSGLEEQLEEAVTRGEIDRFVAGHDFPLVDGTRVTFVWRGEADEVFLRHFVFGLPSTMRFERVGGDVWACSLHLPERSRVEYKIEVVRGESRQWIRDPLNPRLAHDPFGANSVCFGSGYAPPDWTEPDPEARPGRIEEWFFHRTPFGEKRQVGVYLPPRYRETRRYPLLVVHDGGDYLKFARLKVVLDNLIYRGEVQPLIVALSYPGNRLVEYANDPRHASFLVDHLVPTLEQRYPLFATPRNRCLMGASFGAVASLSTAWHNPGFFGSLLVQSGSFAFTDLGENRRGPAFEPVVRFINAFRENPGRPVQRMFMSCGQYETLIYENRSMLPLFREAGIDVRYVEARDGHNWENWRDRLQQGLSWLFRGKLWMVYE